MQIESSFVYMHILPLFEIVVQFNVLFVGKTIVGYCK